LAGHSPGDGPPASRPSAPPAQGTVERAVRIGGPASMSDSHSTSDSEDEVFGRFLEELGPAVDKEAIIRKYAESYPDYATDFRELAAMDQKFAAPRSSDPDPPPETLPDFRILRRIGQGGMGVVYEAEQLSLKRRVAVKVR